MKHLRNPFAAALLLVSAVAASSLAQARDLLLPRLMSGEVAV